MVGEISKYRSVSGRKHSPAVSRQESKIMKAIVTPRRETEDYSGGALLKPQGMSLGVKYALLTALAIAIASIILVIIAYLSISNAVESEIDEAGIMLTKVFAAFDVKFWEDMRDNNQLERISSEVAKKMMIETPTIINLIITKREKAGKDQFIVGVRPPRPGISITLSTPRLLRTTGDEIEITELYYSQLGSAREIRTRGYKRPILDKEGKETGYYVNLFLSARRIDEVLNNILVSFLLPALIALIIGAGIGFLMAQQVTKPVKQLMTDMEEISQGNLDHQAYPLSSDEIGVLTRVFNRMTKSLKIAYQSEVEAKALEHELNIAHEIQANLLPKKIPEIPGYDISTYYRASKEVGGDYYDILLLDESHVGMVVADVSGRGIPGSMVMTMARSLIRMEAERNLSPADTLIKVNRSLTVDIRKGMFVTVLYLVLNIKNHSLLVSSAGHNPLIIWRKNKRNYDLINPNGIALGFDRGPVFERTIKEESLQLNWGDRIVTYTDGVVESMNIHKEEFGSKRFYTLINQLGELDSKSFINKMIATVDQHQGDAPQHDDITLLSVRFSG